MPPFLIYLYYFPLKLRFCHLIALRRLSPFLWLLEYNHIRIAQFQHGVYEPVPDADFGEPNCVLPAHVEPAYAASAYVDQPMSNQPMSYPPPMPHTIISNASMPYPTVLNPTTSNPTVPNPSMQIIDDDESDFELENRPVTDSCDVLRYAIFLLVTKCALRVSTPP